MIRYVFVHSKITHLFSLKRLIHSSPWLTSDTRFLRSFSLTLPILFFPVTLHHRREYSSGEAVLYLVLRCTIMQTSKRHSRSALFRPLRRSASNREVAHEIHVVRPAVESTRRARQCRGTTEEKLRREQRSPCLISPREIYERGSTTGFFLRLFPRCVFCAPLSWFPLRKESVNRARFFDPAVHRDAQWRSANRPFQPGSVSRRMGPAAIFIIALRS